MKTIRSLATLAAVVMMFATFGAGRAHAQAVVQGRFQLPFQARWGTANLSPGTYRIEVEDSDFDVRVVTVWSRATEKRPILVLGLVDWAASPNGANKLICARGRSTCVVQTLQFAVAGETITFPMPKSERIERKARNPKNHVQKRQAAHAIRTVPIVISGR